MGRHNPVEARPIFYAWQSESDAKLNNYFILDCLRRAIKKLNRDELTDFVIDRATDNVAGVADIGTTIYEKIQKASIVISDLTIINPKAIRRENERAVPNANALHEFSYGIGKLSESRVIGIVNTAFGQIEELPFDIRPKRLMSYQLCHGQDKAKVRDQLVNRLVNAIKDCLGETQEDIVKQTSQIHRVFCEIRILGAEVEEWNGLDVPLSKRVSDLLQQAKQLSIPKGWSEAARNTISSIIKELNSAAIVAFNSENWHKIKMHISNAGSRTGFLLDNLDLNLDQQYHDQAVDMVVATPMELESHIESLYEETLKGTELDLLSQVLRFNSFLPLIPEHPQFVIVLREISRDLRHLVLRWSKDKPKTIDMIDNLQRIRNQLLELCIKYTPSKA
jgi:hypothetical protein